MGLRRLSLVAIVLVTIGVGAAAVVLTLAGGDGARPRTVVLVVLDSVRRDHVTPCGETRPVTPNLAKLASQGTTFCRMLASGSWTGPAHASMFTGRLPHVHGVDRVVPAPREMLQRGKVPVSPLTAKAPTLAERFAEAGYRTALVSGNPRLGGELGLARGFDVAQAAPRFLQGREARVAPHLAEVLEERIDPQEQLFAVINISWADAPYEAVPADAGWVDPTPVALDLFRGGAGSLLARFERGEMVPSQRTRLQRDVRRAYAWGVHRADADLGEVLGVLARHDRLGNDAVIVVTSDHGEMLGAQGRLGHGASVARGNLDVFALAVGPGFEAGTHTKTRIQTQDVFPTLLRAAGLDVPERPHAVSLHRARPGRELITVSQPDPMRAYLTDGERGRWRQVAVQRDAQRAVAREAARWVTGAGKGRGPEVQAKGGSVPPELADRAKRILRQARNRPEGHVEMPSRAGMR